MGETDVSNSTVLVAIQIQIGEIKGILNTLVTEHARRIGDNETDIRKLRTDLDAVKNEAKKDLDVAVGKFNDKFSEGSEKGNKLLHTLNTDITTNKNNIAELRSDVVEVKEKQNSSMNRVLAVLASIVAGASLIWNVFGDKV